MPKVKVESILLLPTITLFQLRLPHRNDAEIAKISNFWTFWPVLAELQP